MGLFDGTVLQRPVICDRCGKDIKVCTCPPEPQPDVVPQSQTLKVLTEKRSKGKLVTSVHGFSCSATQIQELLVRMKNACGAGGTCSEESLEIQGDHKARVVEALKQVGYRIK